MAYYSVEPWEVGIPEDEREKRANKGKSMTAEQARDVLAARVS